MEVLALERTLSELDHVRLTKLIRRGMRGGSAALNDPSFADVLNACAIVPVRQVPPDVVTMYSQVLLLDRSM